MNQEHASVYRKLGVEPVVNCGSSRSVYGNSTMSDPVRAAMESASFHHVIMEELGEAVGSRLAELQLRILWEELLARFDKIEVLAEPERTFSSFVNGYTHMPVKVTRKA